MCLGRASIHFSRQAGPRGRKKTSFYSLFSPEKSVLCRNSHLLDFAEGVKRKSAFIEWNGTSENGDGWPDLVRSGEKESMGAA